MNDERQVLGVTGVRVRSRGDAENRAAIGGDANRRFQFVDAGVDAVRGDEFRKVPVDRSQRGGIFTQASFLTLTSKPLGRTRRTSPVLRGAFILEYIAGAPPATPPPGVDAFPEAEIGTDKARTVREIIAKHRENPACFSCHGVMDPLGFALENFDAVGVWRDVDRYNGAPIDSAALRVRSSAVGQRCA